MSTQPLALLPYVTPPFLKIDTDGNLVPNAGGFIYSFETDLTTPKALWTNASGTLVAFGNPIVISADGWPATAPIYVQTGGYSIVIKDSDSVTLKTISFLEDIGATQFGSLGNFQASGTIATSSPYTVPASDNLVIVNSATDPFIVQLPAVATRTKQLEVKNISAVEVRVTPNGAEEIDAISAYVALPAKGSPPVPGLVLLPSATAWWIIGTSGL